MGSNPTYSCHTFNKKIVKKKTIKNFNLKKNLAIKEFLKHRYFILKRNMFVFFFNFRALISIGRIFDLHSEG